MKKALFGEGKTFPFLLSSISSFNIQKWVARSFCRLGLDVTKPYSFVYFFYGIYIILLFFNVSVFTFGSHACYGLITRNLFLDKIVIGKHPFYFELW